MALDESRQIVSLYPNLAHGCDPELFFASEKGEVIGAEKIIPAEGMKSGYYTGSIGMNYNPDDPLPTNIVLDGVQVELNPKPYACRAHLGNEIASIFRTLRNHLEKMNGVSVTFRSVVEVTTEELDSLSEKSKALGCAPSKNIHNKEASIKIDPQTYTTRSAAGHLHFGLPDFLKEHAERIVRLMDVLGGNTCVMIDRDPLAAKRREVYGRCGEFRTPSYGLEYRTLSNFWLRSYPLASFVWGLQRLACGVMAVTVGYKVPFGDHIQWDAEGELLKLVDYEKIAQAINTNDLELARSNYQAIKPFIEKHVPRIECGLDYSLLEDFDYFIKGIDEGGIEKWFSEEPMDHWCSIHNGHNCGWESFLSHDVRWKRIPGQSTRTYSYYEL